MPKAQIAPKPIMSLDDERFMAFEGLVQWTQATVTQAARASAAQAHQFSAAVSGDPAKRRLAHLATQTECHLFTIAAFKVLEYREWAVSFGLCSGIDFSGIDRFSKDDIRDLRNMREHVVAYFKGGGHAPERWVSTTPDSISDASAIYGTRIGGRLDWVAFGEAAGALLEQLLREPIPYPSTGPGLPEAV